METRINFFTPIQYTGNKKTFTQCVQEGIEDYFYLRGQVCVINTDRRSTCLEQNTSRHNVILGAIKIISYVTVIIPLIMLIAKAIYRATVRLAKVETTLKKEEEEGKSSAQSEFHSKYFSTAEEISFLDAYLKGYLENMESEKWNTIPGLLFLNDELNEIKHALTKLQKDTKPMATQYRSLTPGSDIKEDLNSIRGIDQCVQNLLSKIENALKPLQKKIEEKVDGKNNVRGIKNVGNSCYINSAIQPLLAIKNFEQLIPDQPAQFPEHSFEQRTEILDSFKEFLKAWKNEASVSALGAKVGNLRRKIFEVGLLEGGFLHREQERSYQDAGSFFELLLHVLGKGFQLEMTRTPMRDDKTTIECRKRVEKTPQGIFYLQQPGATLQKIVDNHRNAVAHLLTQDNAWKIEDPQTGKEMHLTWYKEMQKIVSAPPEVLVIRVNDHVVNLEQDKCIDFTPLFKNPSQKCEYTLVGFLQNHHQVHWTSIVGNEKNWVHCNDAEIEKVKPTEEVFKRPANYMIYKKS